MNTRLRPVLRYPGAKHAVAPWVISHFPSHEAYVEPFFGSGAVLLAKPRSRDELVNDIDGRVVSFFRVLRDRPEELAAALAATPYARAEVEAAWVAEPTDELELARVFATCAWQSRGGSSGRRGHVWRLGQARNGVASTWAGLPDRVLAAAERLRGVAIDQRDALEVLAQHRKPDTLVYADPPYLGRLRLDGVDAAQQFRLYDHEMSLQQHRELLEALDAHPGTVVLSAYDHPLYTERLAAWRPVRRRVLSQAHTARDEVLWLNPRAARQAMLFAHAEEA